MLFCLLIIKRVCFEGLRCGSMCSCTLSQQAVKTGSAYLTETLTTVLPVACSFLSTYLLVLLQRRAHQGRWAKMKEQQPEYVSVQHVSLSCTSFTETPACLIKSTQQPRGNVYVTCLFKLGGAKLKAFFFFWSY